MKKMTSGQIQRTFANADKNTILRRLNLRYFTKKSGADYIISQDKWLIDFKEFMEKINPRHIRKQSSLPRLRTKISAQNEWNACHRKKIKHHIIDTICNSGKVFIFKHGKYNIINYDELEKELIKELKRRGEY